MSRGSKYFNIYNCVTYINPPRLVGGTSRVREHLGESRLPRSNQSPPATSTSNPSPLPTLPWLQPATLPWRASQVVGLLDPAKSRPRAQAARGEDQIPTKQPWLVGMLPPAMSRPRQSEVSFERAPQNIKPSV